MNKKQESYVFVCPKCTFDFFGDHNEIVYCRYCHTKMIETSITLNEKSQMETRFSPEEYEQALFNVYVKNNPLYDPEEETRTYMKREASESNAQIRSYIKNQENDTPRCPMCKSTNIDKIGALRKGVSIGVLGLMSSDLGKTMVCKDCGYKW